MAAASWPAQAAGRFRSRSPFTEFDAHLAQREYKRISQEEPLRAALLSNATLVAKIREANLFDHLLYTEAQALFARAYTTMQMAAEGLVP